MKLLIAAIGKAKPSSPEHQLYIEYTRRLKWPLECREFAASGKEREGEWLLNACRGYEKRIALDESGQPLSSREFAGSLTRWQQQGCSSFAFLIGGADGLSAEVIAQSHLVWSLGRVTWPHMLVRALLAEQLYRTWSLLNHHPYHRD